MPSIISHLSLNAVYWFTCSGIPSGPNKPRDNFTQSPVTKMVFLTAKTVEKGITKQLIPSICPSNLPLKYTVLPDTNLLGKFKSARKISQICPDGDMAWTLFDNKITLLDRAGKIHQKRIYDVTINTILLQKSTRQLYAYDDEGIIDLSTGARLMYFPSSMNPTSLHFSDDGCVVIGMTGRIAKFTPDGTQIRTTTWPFARFVFTPTKMTECPRTGSIAFFDLDLPKDGGQGERHVQVMDREFREGIRLRVETYIDDIKTPGTNCKGTCDIAFDKGGNLVLVDGRNVFLIDMTSEIVIRTLHTDKYPVISLGLGDSGELWITLSGRSKKVKILEYMDSK